MTPATHWQLSCQRHLAPVSGKKALLPGHCSRVAEGPPSACPMWHCWRAASTASHVTSGHALASPTRAWRAAGDRLLRLAPKASVLCHKPILAGTGHQAAQDLAVGLGLQATRGGGAVAAGGWGGVGVGPPSWFFGGGAKPKTSATVNVQAHAQQMGSEQETAHPPTPWVLVRPTEGDNPLPLQNPPWSGSGCTGQRPRRPAAPAL